MRGEYAEGFSAGRAGYDNRLRMPAGAATTVSSPNHDKLLGTAWRFRGFLGHYLLRTRAAQCANRHGQRRMLFRRRRYRTVHRYHFTESGYVQSGQRLSVAGRHSRRYDRVRSHSLG